MTRQSDSSIPEVLTEFGLHHGHPGESVGHFDHLTGDVMAFLCPGIQSSFVAILQRRS
jgi:hypothetical protein